MITSFSIFLENLARHGVISYGRFNPMHSGHEKLVHKIHEVAKKHGATHKLILSASQDAKKNPLTGEQKLKHAKRAFPNTNVEVASKAHPTLMHHASDLYKSGVRHLHVIAGSDRVDEYKKLLHQYNGAHSKHGHYNFHSITVHSSGERDPDAEGSEGISASKMREFVSKGDHKSFHKHAPSQMSKEHKQELYNDVKKGMGHA